MTDAERCLYAAVLYFCASAAVCAAEPGSSGSTAFLGIEVDNQHSQRLDVGVGIESSRGTRFDLLGSKSEADEDSLDLSSSYAFGQLTHDFGTFGLGAGVRHVRDERLSKTLGYLGSAFVDFGTTRVIASIDARDTDFDEISFTATGAELGLPDVTSASGLASCSVDSIGYGLGLNIDRSRFSLYASATTFDYSSYECTTVVSSTTSGSTTIPGNPAGRAPIRVTRRPAVVQVASNTTRQFRGYSATRIPRQGTLLDSSLMVGTSFVVGARNTGGVELYFDTEEFASSETMTALAYLAFPLTRAVSMSVTLGTSDGDLLENTVFAGARITAAFGD